MGYWDKPGASDEWYTPPHVFEALGCRFTLDVAHPPAMFPRTPCGVWFDSHALSYEWHGFVWMNPPFGGRNGIEPWLAKFFDHGNGIALTPDRTSAPWFQKWAPKADAVLFTPKLRFIRPDGSEGKSPSNGTALLGLGAQALLALERAHRRGLGILMGAL